MDNDQASSLLIRAREAYRRVAADPKRHTDEVQALVAEARRANVPEALCLALRAQAWAERIALSHTDAMRHVNEAIRLAERYQLGPTLGEILVTRGAINQELGRIDAAMRDFEQASTLLPDDLELAAQRAVLYSNLARFRDAEPLHRQILASPSSTLEMRVRTANNWGLAEALTGRFDHAIELFTYASEHAPQLGPVATAMVTEGRAYVAIQAGHLTDGVALFERAARLWEEAGLPLAELYAEYADALMDLRLVPEALDRARRAAAILDTPGVDLMSAEAALRVAQLELLSRDYGRAIASAESAMARFRRQRRSTWAARTQLVAIQARLQFGTAVPADLERARRAAITLEQRRLRSHAVDGYLITGRVADAIGRRRAAVDYWSKARKLSLGSSLLVRLKGELAAALAAEVSGNLPAARRFTRRGLEDLGQHRAALPSTELRTLASGHGEELGRIGLRARVGTTTPARILVWMERTRAAALSRVDPEPDVGLADELGELRAVQAELIAARRETGTEPEELRKRLTNIEERIRRATWTASNRDVMTSAVMSVTDLRRMLNGQVLVEYDMLDDELIAVVLDASRTRLVRIGGIEQLRSELDSLLFSMRYLASDAPASAAILTTARIALDRLRKALLAPLPLPEHSGLVVIPIGELHRVPWVALHDRPVAVAPSAAMWARSAQAIPAHGGDRVVLAAGPELPGAREEVDALRTLYENAVTLTPPDSTVDAVAHALDDAALTHLACHCFLRADNPTFSSLLLSDGYLTVHELDQRSDVPRRVVLAACESGKDATYEGNEILGFISTLMTKGAAGVVASTVVVPDVQLLPLMTGLHREIAKGATMRVALHQARREIDATDPKGFVAATAFNAFGAA